MCCREVGPRHLTPRATVTEEVLGGCDPRSMGEIACARTSPVRVLIGGSGVARRDDVTWCLEWLDQLRVFVAQHVCGIEPHLLEVDEAISAAAARLMTPRGLDSCAR